MENIILDHLKPVSFFGERFSTLIIGDMNRARDIPRPLECRARAYYPTAVVTCGVTVCLCDHHRDHIWSIVRWPNMCQEKRERERERDHDDVIGIVLKRRSRKRRIERKERERETPN